jgi:hypothetical protein
MEETPSLEANMPSDSQEIPSIYNSLQPVPILSQINPFS